MSNTIGALYSDDFTILEQNFANVGIKHKCSTIDSTDSWKSFWNTTQSINWINEWWVSISAHWIHIKLDLSDDFDGWFIHETLVSEQSDSVSDEVNCILLKTKLFEHKLCWLINVNFFVSFWIFLLKVLHSFHELLASSFFHQSHQVWWQGLLWCDRNLGDFHTTLWEESSFFILQYISSINGFPFKISWDSGFKQDFNKLTSGHDIFRN